MKGTEALRWARAQWDRVLGFALIAVGLTALIAGFRGISRTPYVAQQLPYLISGGLGGITAIGLGALLLLLAELRDEWRKLDHLARVLGQAPPATAPADAGHEARGPSELVLAARQPESGQAQLAHVRLVGGVAGLVVGSGLMVQAGSWHSTTLQPDPARGFHSVAYAALGVVLVGLAVAALTLFLRRSIRLRQAQLLAPLHISPVLTQRRGVFQGQAPLMVIRGHDSLHHVRGCPILRGVDYPAVSAERVVGGLQPCALCAGQ